VYDCSGIAKSLQANTDILLKFGHFRLLPLTGRLTGWLADWLIGWLADWLADWLAGWLTD
jgi:hypothetical protein